MGSPGDEEHGSRSLTPGAGSSVPLSSFAAVPHLSVYRESPRPCINQALVDELKPLREMRFMVYGSQAKEGISYATAISAIIGCPFLIETVEQAKQLNKVGDKLGKHIEEFLRTGKIDLTRRTIASQKYNSLKEMSSVYSVGRITALELFDQGLRSVEDMKAQGKWEVGLKYQHDMQIKISREDCESVAEFIKIQLDRIEPGAHTVLLGGYRRGKLLSGDMDLLITYPHQEGREKGVLQRLLYRLQAKGLIPSDGILWSSSYASHNIAPERKSARSFDSLDKAFVIFRHPANGTTRPRDIFRRVDLIVTAWSTYGCAVLGWTGSTQYERDLRKVAEKRGYKFEAGGLSDKHTGAVITTGSEKDIYRVLGIPWCPPHLRNADP